MIEAPIFGLILAGGPSNRMGENKAELIYHDRPQWAYASQLIAPYCREVYFSVRNESQIPDIPSEVMITDTHQSEGPISGVLSAISKFPQNAWLVIAVDFPGADRALINRIFRQRDASKSATCLLREGKIEPLLTIYEPGIFDALSKFANSGKNSMQKFLQGQDIHSIPLDAAISYKLDSIDTQEERTNFLRKGRK